MGAEIIETPIVDGRRNRSHPNNLVEYGGMRIPFSKGQIIFGTQGIIETEMPGQFEAPQPAAAKKQIQANRP